MTTLERKIIERIRKEGPITFETFMGMALYYPGLGYYTSPETLIGRKGDFYTSPHLHPIFGVMLARQLEEMWKIMGEPAPFHAVEIGGGAGYLCKDILEYLYGTVNESNRPRHGRDFLKSLRYVIVEPHRHLEEKQRELVKGERELERILWVTSLKELNDIRGCIFSNELLDAFPVHIVEMEDRLKEIYVAHDGDNFIEQKQEISSLSLTEYMKEFADKIPSNYRTEINLRIKDWIKEIYSVISKGFVLTVDYGYAADDYYDEGRSRGTLLCYHRHRVTENPYENIGRQDITAHVNFSSLKKWGDDIGFKTIGYCPQGTFLISSGIDEVITELYGNSPDYFFEVSKIKGLLLPQGMGESHKVMIQYKGDKIPKLKGFSIRNQLRLL